MLVCWSVECKQSQKINVLFCRRLRKANLNIEFGGAGGDKGSSSGILQKERYFSRYWYKKLSQTPSYHLHSLSDKTCQSFEMSECIVKIITYVKMSEYNHRTVTIQSSYSHHTVIIQSSYSHHTVIIQSSCVWNLVNTPEKLPFNASMCSDKNY